MPNLYQKRQVTIDPVTWTPVVAPIQCSSVTIRNTGAVNVKLRTDILDPLTEDILPPNIQEMIVPSGKTASPQTDYRFPYGGTVCWLQAAAGSFAVMTTYLE